jgi:hypothetical protein
MKVLILFAVLSGMIFASSQTAEAANHYVRAGATGSANGSDWTNACTGFSGSCAVASLVRGDTYYVATGSYGSVTFNKAVSGTTPITIKGATASDHGTDTGWSPSYGVDVVQASFTGNITFNTSYWVFDGSAGPVWSRTPSAYGFTFSAMQYPISIFNTTTAISDVTVAHIAATAPSGDVEKLFVATDNSTKSVSNITISNTYLNGWGNAYWATSAGLTMDNWVFQYNMCLNGFSSTTHHGEWLNNNYGYFTNQITRWNWFEGQQNGTGVIVANNNDNVNAQVYGNVFYNIAEGNGIITGTSSGNLVSPHVYNNTFIASTSGGWIGGNTTGTPIVENNLIYNMSASMAVSGDYNAYFKTTSTPSETHGQVSSADPFLNSAGGDYHLLSETTSGITLPSPFNIDPDGVTRALTDGIWSRGAYQCCGTTSGRPQPPTSLRANVN